MTSATDGLGGRVLRNQSILGLSHVALNWMWVPTQGAVLSASPNEAAA